MFGDPLALVAQLLPRAAPELRTTGRELLDLVAERHVGALGDSTPWPDPPAWLRSAFARAELEAGVSSALLVAVSGELTGFRPDYWTPKRAGIMGQPNEAETGAELLATFEELRAGDTAAAGRVLRAVTLAAHALHDSMQAGPVAGLRWYVEQGRERCDPPALDTVRGIMGRYSWELLARIPQDKARELRAAFR